ncbi:MAG: 50S ribosomal protein L37ae [Candidatus Thorarchaeota archaeon]|nr:50S ribosomal protein L37ae [Candidatus Thorarchaeota archaeon]
MARTKKVGSTGRYGVRYGAKLRRRVLDIDKKRSEPVRCPACATKALRRVAVGLWRCRKCELLFAGGAYVPFTDAGKDAKRAIAQRVAGDFLALRSDDEDAVPDFMTPLTKEVEESTEASPSEADEGLETEIPEVSPEAGHE